MALDGLHPKISLAILMIREAIEGGAHSIILTRGDETFIVLFADTSGSYQRDEIANLHWHGLLAALHFLAGLSAFHDSRNASSVLAETEKSNLRLNSIKIDHTFPDLENGQLRRLRQAGLVPVQVDLSFSDHCVKIGIHLMTNWTAPLGSLGDLAS